MFILPLGDEPNARITPWVNHGLIAANVVVFLMTGFGQDPAAAREIMERWGYVPSAPRVETLFTSLFLHGGVMHLLGNMLFLWIFGDNVEARLGRLRYLLAYLATGAAATLAYGWANPEGTLPLVGASGAISGVEGLYFLAFPHHRVRVLVWFLFFVQVVHVRARLIIAFWFVLNDLIPYLLHTSLLGDMVAHEAHLGGFAAGCVVYLLLRPLLKPDTEERFEGAAGWFTGAPRDKDWRPPTADPYAGGRSRRPGWDDAPAAEVPPGQAILALWRGGRFTQAAELLAQGLRFGKVPEVPEPELFRLCVYLYERGQFDDARRGFLAYLDAHAQSRNAPAAAFALGMIYSRRDHDAVHARPFLEDAVRRHPDPNVRELAQRELAILASSR